MKTLRDKENNVVIPNPALEGFSSFIGEWNTRGSHPYLPGVVLHGRASFEWMAGRAFVIMRTEYDHEAIPDGIAIFGSDNQENELFMLYFDERKVSRVYQAALTNDGLRWWRSSSTFSQRLTITVSDPDTMHCKGEMSKDDLIWEDDIELTYTRANAMS